MNHPTSPTEKNPRICLLSDGVTVVNIPDGNSSPGSTPLPLPVTDYNTFPSNPIQGSSYTAQKAGFHRFNVSAEAENVTDFRLVIFDVNRNSAAYEDRRTSPTPDRVVCKIDKTLYLNLGDVVSVAVQQYGQPNASFWLYSDANYFETEFLG